jgi:hypothetical protein
MGLGARGEANCKLKYDAYNNSTNVNGDPIVAYGIRDESSTFVKQNTQNTCIFSKKSDVSSSVFVDNSNSPAKTVTRCVDNTKYVGNKCESGSFITPGPAKQPVIGYFNTYVPSQWDRNDHTCQVNAKTYNKTTNATSDPYIAYGVHDESSGNILNDIHNKCIYFRQSDVNNSKFIDMSNSPNKIVTQCLDHTKSANDKCV